MHQIDDPVYLRTEQYRDATNLQARIALHARFSTNPLGWMPWVFDQLALPPGARVLEVGCGPGGFWQANAARLPPSWQITLTDFSPGMLAAAVAALRPLGRPFTFLDADAQALPFPAGAFDALISMHMLYHVPNRARALAEFQRVLRPGGAVYITTVGATHLRELDDLLARFDPALALAGALPGPAPFDVEHAGAEIAAVFAEVSYRPYDDALLVDEPGALVAYIRSTPAAGRLPSARAAALPAFVAAALAAAGGTLRIGKAGGVFRAIRR